MSEQAKMKPFRPAVDIQINIPGQKNKVVIDGTDYSNAKCLLIEFNGPHIRYLVGTMDRQEAVDVTKRMEVAG